MNSGQLEDRFIPKTADQLDQKLVSRVQKGDRTAFDLLLVKYQNKVASIVSRYVDRPEDIADLTQEIFIRAYRSIHSFRAESTFYTWLFRIAVNHAKSYLQKNKALKIHQGLQDQKAIEVLINETPDSETPENIFGTKELANGIVKALDSMPAELSIALILREFEGLSYQEIAKVMECPIGTVRSRIFRARELLDNTIKSLSEDMI
jgi:RNA polymerase sigma-70 factor (ECF subfamily)